MIDQQQDFTLLDVREDWELEICKLSYNLIHIPMNQVPNNLDKLDKDKLIIVMCGSGGRSAKITKFLLQNGFTHSFNLTGGILQWAKEIEPSLPTY